MDVEELKKRFATLCVALGGTVEEHSYHRPIETITRITCKIRNPVVISKLTKVGSNVRIEIEKGSGIEEVFDLDDVNDVVIHSGSKTGLVEVDLFGDTASIYDFVVSEYIELSITRNEVRMTLS